MPDRSGYGAQPAVCFRICAKQAPADGFLNECERLPGLMGFGFGCLRTEFHRGQPVFSRFDARLGLLQGPSRVLQLAFGLGDELSSRPLRGFSSLFGVLQSLAALLHNDWARASVFRAWSSMPRKTSAAW